LFLLLPLIIRANRFNGCTAKTTMRIIECATYSPTTGNEISTSRKAVIENETCDENDKEIKLYAAVSFDPITPTQWRIERIARNE
ncbi:hypothetical protein PENTCL1PPCAC_1080, partial [Pristionchus entomophagus]